MTIPDGLPERWHKTWNLWAEGTPGIFHRDIMGALTDLAAACAALREIVSDDGMENGVYDEWGEAAGFRRVQDRARAALDALEGR